MKCTKYETCAILRTFLAILTAEGNYGMIWALARENLTLVFANNKGADQPAHLRRLICAFVISFWKESYLNLLQAKLNFLASVCS